MDIIQNAEKWAWDVALKKTLAAACGILIGQKASLVFVWLEAHGIKVQIDLAKFQDSFTLLGGAAFVALHDYLKLKFPDTNWL